MNVDFAPTFLDFAGVEIPSDIQGISMKNPYWRMKAKLPQTGVKLPTIIITSIPQSTR